MMKIKLVNKQIVLRCVVFVLGMGCFGPQSVLAMADLKPEKIHTADSKKTKAYVRDGLITGGDRAMNEVIVKDIRRAANSGFERVVIDVNGNRNGEEAAIARPPYYQVAVNPDESRIVITMWGHMKLAFNPKKIIAAFKRSHVVENVILFPVLEDDTWTFVFEIKTGHPVEVFELSNPARVIMDIRG